MCCSIWDTSFCFWPRTISSSLAASKILLLLLVLAARLRSPGVRPGATGFPKGAGRKIVCPTPVQITSLCQPFTEGPVVEAPQKWPHYVTTCLGPTVDRREQQKCGSYSLYTNTHLSLVLVRRTPLLYCWCCSGKVIKHDDLFLSRLPPVKRLREGGKKQSQLLFINIRGMLGISPHHSVGDFSTLRHSTV